MTRNAPTRVARATRLSLRGFAAVAVVAVAVFGVAGACASEGDYNVGDTISTGQYPDNADCSWTIVTEETWMVLSFSQLEFEENYDNIWIEDSDGHKYRYRSEENNPSGIMSYAPTTICTNPNPATIRLTSDGSVVGGGFTVEVTANSPFDATQCSNAWNGEEFETEGDDLSSFNFPWWALGPMIYGGCCLCVVCRILCCGPAAKQRRQPTARSRRVRATARARTTVTATTTSTTNSNTTASNSNQASNNNNNSNNNAGSSGTGGGLGVAAPPPAASQPAPNEAPAPPEYSFDPTPYTPSIDMSLDTGPGTAKPEESPYQTPSWSLPQSANYPSQPDPATYSYSWDSAPPSYDYATGAASSTPAEEAPSSSGYNYNSGGGGGGADFGGYSSSGFGGGAGGSAPAPVPGSYDFSMPGGAATPGGAESSGGYGYSYGGSGGGLGSEWSSSGAAGGAGGGGGGYGSYSLDYGTSSAPPDTTGDGTSPDHGSSEGDNNGNNNNSDESGSGAGTGGSDPYSYSF